jgi:hypothetical protein
VRGDSSKFLLKLDTLRTPQNYWALQDLPVQVAVKLCSIFCFCSAYSVDAHLLDGMYHRKGLLLDVNCITPELQLQHCQWRYARKIPCLLYLGVNCAGKIEA